MQLEMPRHNVNITANLKQILCETVNKIHLAQDRDQWRALVNTVMFWVP
jgi:hypothetical protein